MATLLGVDIGLRLGVAAFEGDGRLRWVRSRHFGTTAAMRRFARGVPREVKPPVIVFAEGGGPLEAAWRTEARSADAVYHQLHAETWRTQLLQSRQRRTGKAAKLSADALAREVFRRSGLSLPKTLKPDAAEAVVIGLFGVLQMNWLAESESDIA